MISFDEARQIIKEHLSFFGEEDVHLAHAAGRVLAGAIFADRDYPPFNRAAMDGYAIKYEDWLNGIRSYTLTEVILAGQQASKILETGFCYKIMTGAAVPRPADVVIRVEDSLAEEGQVRLTATEMRPWLNIARQGEDLRPGDPVIDRNSTLTPQLISILAATGHERVRVQKLPAVAVITTGDEVVPIGQKVLPYQIRNSNAHLISALLRQNGIVPGLVTHVKDQKEAIKTNLEKALAFDLVIVNGGVSAGDADYVPQLLEVLGVKKLFHKVAIRPGKPIWVGAKPNGGLVFALPGNPFSCMVTFQLFIRVFLDLSMGLNPRPFLQLPFEGSRNKKANLDEFFPVRFNTSAMTLQPAAINGSGDIRLGINADAIAWHPADLHQINPGDLVKFMFL